MERNVLTNVMPNVLNGRLIEGRCAGCGRLMFKFALGTEGVIEIKCWASRCKELNTFRVDSVSSHVIGLATT